MERTELRGGADGAPGWSRAALKRHLTINPRLTAAAAVIAGLRTESSGLSELPRLLIRRVCFVRRHVGRRLRPGMTSSKGGGGLTSEACLSEFWLETKLRVFYSHFVSQSHLDVRTVFAAAAARPQAMIFYTRREFKWKRARRRRALERVGSTCDLWRAARRRGGELTRLASTPPLTGSHLRRKHGPTA